MSLDISFSSWLARRFLRVRVKRSALLLQVAVDFWAPWCEPCKALDEVFALLAADNGHAKFLRVRPAHPRLSAVHLLLPACTLC